MNAVPTPRARTRPAPSLPTPLGYPVIGGPRRPSNMPDTCTFPSGYFSCLTGNPIKVWPFRAGADIIGLYCFEYRTNLKRERVGITIHAYELHDGAWRYIGKAEDREDAKAKIDARWRQRQRPVNVQPVATKAAPIPRQRTRPSPHSA